MEEQSFWELLFSKESIAGVWAVIGALIALVGIFANNLWENARHQKEREHLLIRDAYIGAIEYINYFYYRILRIAHSGVVEDDQEAVIASEKFYSLFLIASPQVIEAFTKLSLRYTEIIMELGDKAFDLQECSQQIQFHQQQIDNALSAMEQINLNRKEYNDKEKNIPELWALYEQHYQEAQDIFDLNMAEIEIKNDEKVELQMKLLKHCIECAITTNGPMFNAIILMRNDIDRKLNSRELREITNSIKSLEAYMNTTFSEYLEKLHLRILETETD